VKRSEFQLSQRTILIRLGSPCPPILHYVAELADNPGVIPSHVAI
jgi:hypothetical protein